MSEAAGALAAASLDPQARRCGLRTLLGRGNNRRLFREATQALPDADVRIEQPTPNNFVVRVEHDGRVATLPANKNLLQLGERTIELEGVVVCVRDGETQKAYLPMEAAKLIAAPPEPVPAGAP